MADYRLTFPTTEDVIRGLHALVEDPDLRAVADADDVAVDEDDVACAE